MSALCKIDINIYNNKYIIFMSIFIGCRNVSSKYYIFYNWTYKFFLIKIPLLISAPGVSSPIWKNFVQDSWSI